MYLARLRLNPRSGCVRRDLGNPYDMHRTLTRAFAGRDGHVLPRFLWRLHVDASWAQPEILVQSACEGNWSELESTPEYLMCPAENKQVPVDTWLYKERPFRFRLRANPTVFRSGKRLGLIGEDAQVSWLRQRSARHGFQVESVLVTGTEVMKAFKGGKRVTLRTATFDGLLLCTDVEMLRDALVQGVGRGKAFGLGLLSLAPIHLR